MRSIIKTSSLNTIIIQIFQFINIKLYKILGAHRSSQLATSTFGRYLFNLLNKNNNKFSIFEGIDGIKLKLTQQEALVTGIFHCGIINQYETYQLKKILKSGNAFIDIGGYVDGWHSIIASKLIGSTGQVYTFEPDPVSYKRLVENVKLNSLKNVILENMAVAGTNGISNFYPAAGSGSLLSSQLEATGIKSIASIRVKTTTVDGYIRLKKIKKLKLIKIDAEGAEMEIIKGAKKTLSKFDAPDLMIEVKDEYLKNAGTSEKELINYLKKFNYRPYFITENGLQPYNFKQLTDRVINLYFSQTKY